METSTINRDLATLRRMFKLAEEWGTVSKIMPKVRMLPGENHRERVVSRDEEKAYLDAAAPLLADFAVIELDCGLRPEEAHRLKWDQIRGGNVEIHTGKREAARRSIPASPRVLDMLLRRRECVQGEWVFPAPTKTGHINHDSLKKQHTAAIAASGLASFVVYSLRHTCLTRWAESGMDVFTLKRLAGHSNISTTMRYVHMSGVQDRAALEKVWRGHKNGHNTKTEPISITAGMDVKSLKSVG
jgi:integrase